MVFFCLVPFHSDSNPKSFPYNWAETSSFFENQSQVLLAWFSPALRFFRR